MTYILGIDPGTHGAYAILTKKKQIIKVCKLFSSFQEVLEDLKPYLGKIEACLENVSANRAMAPKGTTTFLKNAGAWEGLLIALEIPYTLVSPSVWPKKVLDKPAPTKPLSGVNPKQIRKIEYENRKLRKLHNTAFILRKLPKARKYFKFKYDQDKADALCIALYKLTSKSF